MTLGNMNHEDDSSEELIQLEPLVHQVGGHSSMFVLDDATICKPLIGREYRFYRTLPVEMKKFVPEFRGNLEVVLQEDGKELSLAALPSEQMSSLRSSLSALQNRRLRRLSSSSIEVDSDDEDDCCVLNSTPVTPTSPQPDSAMVVGVDVHNPWLQKCHQTHLHKLKLKSDSSSVMECIMLENLTFKYQHPCILDLKMGTRQYGDDATESKRKSQTAKAAETTSVTLGVRLAGMQVYNKEKKCYICKNKYFGRQLTEDGFRQALGQFLHNGRRTRIDAADVIVSKLEELRSIVAKLESVRFFTSSLLILYDGLDLCAVPCAVKAQTREHDCERESDCENHPQGRVKARSESKGEEVGVSRGERDARYVGANKRDGSAGGGGKAPREPITKADSDPPYKTKHRHRPRSQRTCVDIRMIDFAHSTHMEMGDMKVYTGSDEGILLGLDSLIKIFFDIRDNCEF